MNEKWISKKVRESWRSHVQSFESCGIQSVPDLYVVTGRLQSFWIELKIVNSQAEQLPFRHGQPQWIESHQKAGGLTYIICAIKDSSSLIALRCWNVRELSFYSVDEGFKRHGIITAALNRAGVQALEWAILDDLTLAQATESRSQCRVQSPAA